MPVSRFDFFINATVTTRAPRATAVRSIQPVGANGRRYIGQPLFSVGIPGDNIAGLPGRSDRR